MAAMVALLFVSVTTIPIAHGDYLLEVQLVKSNSSSRDERNDTACYSNRNRDSCSKRIQLCVARSSARRVCNISEPNNQVVATLELARSRTVSSTTVTASFVISEAFQLETYVIEVREVGSNGKTLRSQQFFTQVANWSLNSSQCGNWLPVAIEADEIAAALNLRLLCTDDSKSSFSCFAANSSEERLFNSSNCLNNGSFVLDPVSYKPLCSCLTGYSGHRCQFSKCDGVHCMNGGSCLPLQEGFACICTNEHGGKICELYTADVILPTPLFIFTSTLLLLAAISVVLRIALEKMSKTSSNTANYCSRHSSRESME